MMYVLFNFMIIQHKNSAFSLHSKIKQHFNQIDCNINVENHKKF